MTHFVVFLFPLLSLSCANIREHYVTTSDGVRLAYQYKPVQNEKGTVLLLHGLGSSLDEWYTLIGLLNRSHWSTVAIDFRGHGFSRQWKGRELDWNQLTEKGRLSMQRDIEAAHSLIGSEKPIWLIGASLGANLALQYAAENTFVKGLVLLSPGFDYGGIQSEPAVKLYGNRPMMIVASQNEPGGPQIVEALKRQAQGPVEALLLKEAGHGAAILENEKDVKKGILEWLNRNTR